MDFMDSMKAMPTLYGSTTCIMEEGSLSILYMTREMNIQDKQLSVVQLYNGLKKAYPVYLAIHREEVKETLCDMPCEITPIFEEFKDVILSKLWREKASIQVRGESKD